MSSTGPVLATSEKSLYELFRTAYVDIDRCAIHAGLVLQGNAANSSSRIQPD